MEAVPRAGLPSRPELFDAAEDMRAREEQMGINPFT